MKRKQIVSLFLAVVLLLALAAPVCAESPGLSNFKKQTEYTGFSDVPSSAWYAESVKTVCEYGLMNGKTASEFSPSGNVTIAEAIAIGCRLHDIYSGGSEYLNSHHLGIRSMLNSGLLLLNSPTISTERTLHFGQAM